jgi:hypothetical protein
MYNIMVTGMKKRVAKMYQHVCRRNQFITLENQPIEGLHTQRRYVIPSFYDTIVAFLILLIQVKWRILILRLLKRDL